MVTQKYPSDNETGSTPPATDTATKKFPSDNETGGIPPYRPPVGNGNSNPPIQTLKFPSDNETGYPPPSGGVYNRPPVIVKIKQDDERGQIPGGVYNRPSTDSGPQTLKYPSDNETGTPPPGGNIPPYRPPVLPRPPAGDVYNRPPVINKIKADNETGNIPPYRPPYNPPQQNNNGYQQALQNMLQRMQAMIARFQSRWG